MSKDWGEFLCTRNVTDTPRGDFINDAWGDTKMLNAKTWDEVESIVRGKHACEEAIREAKKIWRAYERQLTVTLKE